jgi:hypothetical protein
MPEGRNQEMTAYIRISIHHYKGALPFKEHQINASHRVLAKNAAGRLFAFNKLHPPGGV